MRRWLVSLGALSLWAGCGGEVTPADDPVDSVAGASELQPPASLAKDRHLEVRCWAADIDLPEGECITAHAHIAKALNSCWSHGGEAVNVAVSNACATGYRAAAVACCPALANATPPPATLPDAFGADGPALSSGSCMGASGSSSQRMKCVGATSINDDIARIVATAAAEGEEIRSFHFADRCSDGGFATSGYSACSAGKRPE